MPSLPLQRTTTPVAIPSTRPTALLQPASTSVPATASASGSSLPPRSRTQTEPFTSVTACSHPPSPEGSRTKAPASRSGRRHLVRSGTNGSLPLTPSSTEARTPDADAASLAEHSAAFGPAPRPPPTLRPSSCPAPVPVYCDLFAPPFTTDEPMETVDDRPAASDDGVDGLRLTAKGVTANNDIVEDGTAVADDEGCFVDPDKPKIDFLALLPFELALCIFYHLPSHRDLLRASAVSRAWRQMATDNIVWRDRFFQNPGWAIRSDAELVLQRQDRLQKAAALEAKQRAEDEEHRTVSAARQTALRSWRETLHIPSLPDLSSLSISASASLSLGGSASFKYSTASSARSDPRGQNAVQPSSSSASSAQASASSNRFGFFSSPARGPSTPAGRRRAQQASTSSSIGGGGSGDTTLESIDGSAAAADNEPALGSAALAEKAPEEGFVSTLDWRRLYRDRYILDQRWRRCRVQGGYDVVDAHPKSRSSPRAFEPTKRFLLGHKDSVYCVQHDEGVGSGTQGKVVSGSRDWTIRVWDIETGDCRHILHGHRASVLSLQYDDRILVTGSSDSLVFVWDFASVMSTTEQVESLESLPSGRVEEAARRSSSSIEATTQPLHENARPPIEHTSAKVLATLRGHTSGVLDVAFDDEWIVSCSKDTTVRVWKRADLSFYRRYAGHSGPVNAAQLQGGKVVSAAGDGSIHLWQIGSGETMRVFSGHERGLACIAFSGNMVISGSNDQTIRTWDADEGRCLSVFKGHDHLVRAVAYDGRRRMIASGGYDKRIKLWDADAGDRPVREIKAHVARIFDIELDCTRVISASEDQAVCISYFGGGGIDASLFV
ncbi:hypothetical protein ACQY0O_000895 [Thecaphora frezii]